jgi:hypothetical protein
MVQTFTKFGTPAPAPSANASPQPTSAPWISTSTANVKQSTALSTGATFHGTSGLLQYETNETDTGARSTVTMKSDAYIALVDNATRVNGVDTVLLGTLSADSNGVAWQTSYPAPGYTVNESPFVPNATWTNTAARTESENDPSGQSQTSTYAADGSYEETVSFPEGATGSIQANADGSGEYSIPTFGVTTANSAFTISPPSGGTIPVEYTVLGAGFPQGGGFEVPVWYPSLPPVLASDRYVNEGSASVPADCNVPATYTSSGSIAAINETKSRLDTVLGELETENATSYVSTAYGTLCITVDDDLQTYYDYSGQSLGIVVFSASPLEETEVKETLGLQSAQVALLTASASRRSDSNLSPLRAIVSLARVRAVIGAVHERHVRALYKGLHAGQSR